MNQTATEPIFDFENAEPWNVGDSILGIGDFVCEITSATSGRNKNNNPEVQVEVGCLEGSRRDWLVYGSPNDTKGIGVRKVATLFGVAGVQLLNTDVSPDGTIKEEKVRQLLGKKVGVLVRKEKPEDEYPRIAGYVDPSAIQGGAATTSTASSSGSDADIPF